MNATRLLDDKTETKKQWDQDPCGASTVEGEERESLAFFRAARAHRYEVYAPWFDRVMGFADYKNQYVLEIGPGLGSDHFRFAEQGNRMTALDLSREHLRLTSKHLELEGYTTEAVYGDAEAPPFPDERFDLVYSFGVLHHTPDTAGAIRHVHRMLKPGGTAIIGLYHRDSLFFWLSTICIQGILKGGLWKDGYRHLVSRIEYRSETNDAIPLVKVYSRLKAARLFKDFRAVQIQVTHRIADYESLQKWIPIPKGIQERWFGWYLVIKAVK